MSQSIPRPAYYWCDLHEAKVLKELLLRMEPAPLVLRQYAEGKLSFMQLTQLDLRLKWFRMCCDKASEGKVLPLVVVSPPESTEAYLAHFWTTVDPERKLVEWATALAEWLIQKQRVREELRERLTVTG